jgi:hypothetical protein
MNQPWECPRCNRMNAPFNPSCFCSSKDSLTYLETVFSDPNSKQQSNGLLIDWRHCSICNSYHSHGMQCATL